MKKNINDNGIYRPSSELKRAGLGWKTMETVLKTA